MQVCLLSKGRCLKVFCWRRTLTLWNRLVNAPHGSLYRASLLDTWQDACGFGVKNLSSSVSRALAGLGHAVPDDSSSLLFVPVEDVIHSLKQSLAYTPIKTKPRTAPSESIMLCTYHDWFLPNIGSSCFYAIPMSARRMKLFLGFRLGTHKLPIYMGRQSGVQRVCPHCLEPSVGDEYIGSTHARPQVVLCFVPERG